MNEWLNDELAELQQAKQDKTAKDQRLTLLQQQTVALWNDLKPVLHDAVDKMNAMDEFRRLTGGISYAMGEHALQIMKQTTLPAVELAVSRNPVSITLDYTLFHSPRGPARKPMRANLDVDLDDNGRPFFRLGEAALTIEQAVHHMLRPFLHPELLS